MKNEIMEEAQFVRAMSEPGVTLEDLEEMVAEKRRKSREENEARARHLAELEKQREEERAREAAREKHQDNTGTPFIPPMPTDFPPPAPHETDPTPDNNPAPDNNPEEKNGDDDTNKNE